MKKGHTGPSKTGKTRKHAVSRKIENFCLARMIAVEHLKEGRVHVRYISSHTNHEVGIQECRHLPLPQSVKRDIQQQFATGVSLEKIIDSKNSLPVLDILKKIVGMCLCL